jgi:hypothetical protein
MADKLVVEAKLINMPNKLNNYVNQTTILAYNLANMMETG